MISISKLKNIIDKNFDFIEIKKQNLIKIQLKENNNYFLENNNYFLENNENDNTNNDNENYIGKNDEQHDTNFFLNSFINVIDSYKFDIEDWQFIHNHKND